MTWFPFGGRGTLCGVVIDIGSGSVGASIIHSNQRKLLPEILYTHRAFMPVKAEPTHADRVRHMRHALFSVMLELSQKGMPLLRSRGIKTPIERIFVSCTAPWSHTATQMIHFEKDEPFIVTHELIDQIVQHASEKEAPIAEAQRTELKQMGMQIVERSVVDITINGYATTEPYGRIAREVEVAHLRGLVPNDILTALADIQKNILSDIPLVVRTSALVLYCVLRDVYPELRNALIVEVSGEATECSLMQNSVLLETASVPSGMHTLTREVATRFKTIPEEARIYLRSYKQDALTEAQERTLSLISKRYAQSLESALATLAERYPLPKTAFLIIDQAMQPFFTDALHQALAQHGGVGDKVIRPITPAQAERFATMSPGVVADPRLALTARFFHKLHACGEIDN